MLVQTHRRTLDVLLCLDAKDVFAFLVQNLAFNQGINPATHPLRLIGQAVILPCHTHFGLLTRVGYLIFMLNRSISFLLNMR